MLGCQLIFNADVEDDDDDDDDRFHIYQQICKFIYLLKKSVEKQKKKVNENAINNKYFKCLRALILLYQRAKAFSHENFAKLVPYTIIYFMA